MSSICPGTYSFYIYLYFTVFDGWTDAGQKLDNKPYFVQHLSSYSPTQNGVSGLPWPTCCQTGHKLDNLTCFCPNCVFSIPTLKLDKCWTKFGHLSFITPTTFVLHHPFFQPCFSPPCFTSTQDEFT